MSLILDALKRSERHRRHHTPGPAAGLPAAAAPPGRRTPRWGLVIGTLLAVNALAVLALLRPWNDAPAVTATAPEPGFRPPDTLSLERMAERGAFTLDQSMSAEPRRPGEPAVANPAGTEVASLPEARAQTDKREPPGAATGIPTEVPEGLPELSLNVHVHTRQAEGRFVVINMTRYHEGERLREGPMLERITQEGAILSWQGTRFLLPR